MRVVLLFEVDALTVLPWVFARVVVAEHLQPLGSLDLVVVKELAMVKCD